MRFDVADLTGVRISLGGVVVHSVPQSAVGGVGLDVFVDSFVAATAILGESYAGS